METLKKIDPKTWVIIILGLALVISFFFGQRNTIDTHKDDIDKLHSDNALLIKRNDSLFTENAKLDKQIQEINIELSANNEELADTQSELDKLKKKSHEIPTTIRNMSATSVSNSFTDYLKRTKSKNNN